MILIGIRLMIFISNNRLFHYPKSKAAIYLWILEEIKELEVKASDEFEKLDIVYCVYMLKQLGFDNYTGLSVTQNELIRQAHLDIKCLPTAERLHIYGEWSFTQFKRLRKITPYKHFIIYLTLYDYETIC